MKKYTPLLILLLSCTATKKQAKETLQSNIQWSFKNYPKQSLEMPVSDQTISSDYDYRYAFPRHKGVSKSKYREWTVAEFARLKKGAKK